MFCSVDCAAEWHVAGQSHPVWREAAMLSLWAQEHSPQSRKLTDNIASTIPVAFSPLSWPLKLAFLEGILSNTYKANIIENLLCERHWVEPWKNKGKCIWCFQKSYLHHLLCWIVCVQQRSCSLPTGHLFSRRQVMTLVGHLLSARGFMHINNSNSMPHVPLG